jgi:hypothetical protein
MTFLFSLVFVLVLLRQAASEGLYYAIQLSLSLVLQKRIQLGIHMVNMKANITK